MKILGSLIGRNTKNIQVLDEDKRTGEVTWSVKAMDRDDFAQHLERMLNDDNRSGKPKVFRKLALFVARNEDVIKETPEFKFELVGNGNTSKGKLGETVAYLDKQLENQMPALLNRGKAGDSTTDEITEAMQLIKKNIADLTETNLSLNVRDGNIEVALNQTNQGKLKLIDAPDIDTRNLTIIVNGKQFRAVDSENRTISARFSASTDTSPTSVPTTSR